MNKTQLSALQLFGLVVRKHRKVRGFSQESFADACGVDRSYMGGIERGERNLALLNILKIIQALDLPLSEFFKELDDLLLETKRKNPPHHSPPR